MILRSLDIIYELLLVDLLIFTHICKYVVLCNEIG
jgi:hypothetical protein